MSLTTSNTMLASELNNKGVRLIESQQYDEAVVALSSGLSIVKKFLAGVGANDADADAMVEESDKDCGSDNQSPLCHFSQAPKCVYHNKGDMEVEEDEEEQYDTPFVFRRPLVIPTENNQVTHFKHHVKMSFVLLYNLALTHHLSALQGEKSQKRLRKALALYELAYTIQMNENIQLTILQTMAIVNNLGQIHAAMDNDEKAEQCFQHLLSTLMFVNDACDHDAADQIDGFISNVLSLILSSTAAGAA
jgi:tetratricopeptide (TPR) repeat protein